MKNGGGALAPQRNDKAKNGTKVPSPDCYVGGALAPQKEMIKQEAGLKSKLQDIAGLKSHLQDMSRFQHLPHIDLIEHYQFITFRTHDSIDEFIRKWDFSPDISNKEKQLKIDEYLDSSKNGAYLENEVLEYLYEFLISQDKKLYELVAFAIMNNHVHILFKQLKSLSKIMQIIKGVSAKRINELLGKNGKFWADDYYDKVIRDERHFWVVYEYIKNNPLKICGVKVPPPRYSGTKVPLPKDNGTKIPSPRYVSFPRFYGIFE